MWILKIFLPEIAHGISFEMIPKLEIAHFIGISKDFLATRVRCDLFYAGGSGRPSAPLTKGDVLYGHFNSTVSTIHRILEKRSFLFLPSLNPLFYRGPGHYRQAWPGFEPEHRRNEGVTVFPFLVCVGGQNPLIEPLNQL